MKEKNKGITLVALIVTIILMLLLAVVTVGAVNSGLFNYAGKVKPAKDEADNREKINNAYLIATGKSKTEGSFISTLQQTLNEVFGENQAEAIEDGTGLVVRIGDTYYSLDKNGKTGEGKRIEAIQNAGDITRGRNGETYTGTAANPYRIKCIEDLVAFSKNVCNGNAYQNKYIVLDNDLDFNSIFSYSNYKSKYSYNGEQNAYIPDENSQTTIKELCTTGQGFIPIGKSDNSFKGFFDGQNYELKNIYMNRSGNVALFMNFYLGKEIKNLTISGHIISTTGNAAGIVYSGRATGIINCVNKAKIEGQTSAAGIVYDHQDTSVIRCGNEGEIICHGSGNARAAGISAQFSASTINKCYNKGKITSEGGNYNGAGGICGRPQSGNQSLMNCYNTGDVTCLTGWAGGMTMYSGGTMKNCYNLGTISGGNSSGSGGVARYYSEYEQ